MASTRNARRKAAHDLLRDVLLVLAVGLGACDGGRTHAMTVPASAFPDPSARAFVEAVAAGRVDEAVALGRRLPAGVNVRGASGETALLVAVARLDKKMVGALLAAGADPNGAEGRAPLVLAAQAKDSWFARTLLKAGASPDAESGGSRALHQAVMVHRDDMVDLLLDAGAGIDLANDAGYTPSMVAAEIDDFAMVEHLLAKGASAYAADDSGLSLAFLTAESQLSSRHPAGQARDRVAARLKAAGLAWPPDRQATLAAQRAGRWPFPPR